MRAGSSSIALVVAVAGCAAASTVPEVGAPVAAAARAVPSASAAGPSDAAAASPSAAVSAPAVASAAPPPADPFSPAAFTPPFERTAQPGDGTWSALPEVPADAEAIPPMLRSMVHPHKIKKHIRVALVAMDLERLELRLVAGTKEPKNPAISRERRGGLVPLDAQTRLLAVFNGGWMASHGHHGMKLGDDLFVPPKPGACTVLLGGAAAVTIGTWERVEPQAASASAWRQGPPCLVEQGSINADVTKGSTPWGLSKEGKADIRRSALGIDASGRVLYFGLGEWLTASELALGMHAVGAVDVAELDVNWAYTRFLFFGHKTPDGPLDITSTLLDDIKHARREYVGVAAQRDFFYVARRPAE